MAKSEGNLHITIQLSAHQYPIYIGYNGLSDVALIRELIGGQQVMIVTNSTIAPLYLEYVRQAFTSIQCDTVILDDGEMHKNQVSLNRIYDALMRTHHHRDTTLIALGGGVIGDITGFAAATYQRGVSYIQMPTTLLAQIDSSVGGKTAINHSLGKNMIGSFYQPRAVITDLTTLQTLPERELRAGFAEVIKYGFLEGGGFLQRLVEVIEADILTTNKQQLVEIIAFCCQIKADIVQDDEREHGKRALLNLGHTFAHALESYTEYQRWRHGEAVAIGLYCAALLSYNMNVLNHAHLRLVDSLLQKAGLPRRIPKDIELNLLHNLLFNDKKVKDNRLRFVLMRQPGDCYLDDAVSNDIVRQTLVQAVEEENNRNE